ncbi:MAG: hypothetical protein AB1722_08075 [Pseudomonadota bacterium]
MIRLPDTLAAWDSADFETVCRREVAALGVSGLPLQRCLAAGSQVLPKPVSVTVLGAEEIDGVLRIRAGIFFTSTIAGCSCADDPSPSNELNEYGVLRFEIDRATAATRIEPVDD